MLKLPAPLSPMLASSPVGVYVNVVDPYLSVSDPILPAAVQDCCSAIVVGPPVNWYSRRVILEASSQAALKRTTEFVAPISRPSGSYVNVVVDPSLPAISATWPPAA